MKSTTLNQVFDGFAQFAESHPSVHSYDLGTELKLDIKKSEQFAKMFVLIGPAVYNNPAITANFTVIIVDKVLTDKQNQVWYINEVMSDLLQVCTDMIMYLKTERLIQSGTSVTMDPVFFDQDNVLSGWSFNLSIQTDMKITSCEINIQ